MSFTTNDPAPIIDPSPMLIFFCPNDFLIKVKLFDFSNSAILIKGARKFRFEKIVTLFEERKQTGVALWRS